MCLGPFEGGDEGVGEGEVGEGRERGRAEGGEAVEGDVGAELEGAGVARLGPDAGSPEKVAVGKECRGDVQRSYLRVATPPREAHRVLQCRGRLARQRLLHRARSRPHSRLSLSFFSGMPDTYIAAAEFLAPRESSASQDR